MPKRRRCQYIRPNGTQCKNPAVVGNAFCRYHQKQDEGQYKSAQGASDASATVETQFSDDPGGDPAEGPKICASEPTGSAVPIQETSYSNGGKFGLICCVYIALFLLPVLPLLLFKAIPSAISKKEKLYTYRDISALRGTLCTPFVSDSIVLIAQTKLPPKVDARKYLGGTKESRIAIIREVDIEELIATSNSHAAKLGLQKLKDRINILPAEIQDVKDTIAKLKTDERLKIKPKPVDLSRIPSIPSNPSNDVDWKRNIPASDIAKMFGISREEALRIKWGIRDKHPVPSRTEALPETPWPVIREIQSNEHNLQLLTEELEASLSPESKYYTEIRLLAIDEIEARIKEATGVFINRYLAENSKKPTRLFGAVWVRDGSAVVYEVHGTTLSILETSTGQEQKYEISIPDMDIVIADDQSSGSPSSQKVLPIF